MVDVWREILSWVGNFISLCIGAFNSLCAILKFQLLPSRSLNTTRNNLVRKQQPKSFNPSIKVNVITNTASKVVVLIIDCGLARAEGLGAARALANWYGDPAPILRAGSDSSGSVLCLSFYFINN